MQGLHAVCTKQHDAVAPGLLGRVQGGVGLLEQGLRGIGARIVRRLQAELVAIPNAVETVRAVHARLQGRIACASGADRQKVEMQLAQVGLAPLFAGRIFSGHEMPATKPAPDVYLAAAAALGVPPARCLVVEDTVTGVQAGVAAGATVVGFSPDGVGHGSPAALRAAGAQWVLSDMALLTKMI